VPEDGARHIGRHRRQAGVLLGVDALRERRLVSRHGGDIGFEAGAYWPCPSLTLISVRIGSKAGSMWCAWIENASGG